jgi:hypothetical protein
MIDLDNHLTIMTKTHGVNHPRFIQLSPTHYLIKDPSNTLSSTVHVGQVADFLQFDEQLRAEGLSSLQSMPVGFNDFAYFWNIGARYSDPLRISRVYIPSNENDYYVEASQTPVNVKDFFISQEQVRLAAPAQMSQVEPPRDPFHDELTREYLMDAMEQRRNNHRGYAQRQEQRERPFNQGPRNLNNYHTSLSRLQFKGKHRQRSQSPVRRAPTPGTSGTNNEKPIAVATPSVEHNEQSEESAYATTPMETAN